MILLIFAFAKVNNDKSVGGTFKDHLIVNDEEMIEPPCLESKDQYLLQPGEVRLLLITC